MNEEEYVFYMPAAEKQEESFRAMEKERADRFPVSFDKINDLVKGMTDYSLDTIELHITGVAKTGSITELLIGAEGEAGMKLILNKKQ